MAGTRKKTAATGTRGTATKGRPAAKRGIATKRGVVTKRGTKTKRGANMNRTIAGKRAAASGSKSKPSKAPAPALAPAALRTRLAQRETELALINSIQQALAARLEFQAVVDLVGDQLRALFATPDLAICWFDEAANLVRTLYVYEHGQRLRAPPRPPTPGGVYETMRKSRVPHVFNRSRDYERYNLTPVPGTDSSRSMLSVPIVVGDRFLGDISIENFERENAFSPSDIRLVSTVAGSLGAALENARLFDETQRLLKETEQRAAELAVINSIQQGVAAELDFQAIVDLVGDKLRQVLKTGELGIRWFDYKERVVHYLYEFEHGVRLTVPSAPPRSTTWEVLTSRREPLLIGTAAEIATKGTIPGTDTSKSLVQVPIVGSDRVIGGILVENYEREHAFSESDIRLLSTVASSMGVALENARLFDETQRLLKETEQRAAELAVINRIQEGMAAELDFQAIVDLVGDKLREVFDTGDIGIVWHDPGTDLLHSLYVYEHGKRLSMPPARPTVDGPWSQISRSRQMLLLNSVAEMRARGLTIVPGTDQALCMVRVPILGSDRVLGTIDIENFERENAFGASEIRLLSTVAASMGVALENARLFDETQRLLKETEQRNAELAVINSIQQGMARSLDFQGIVDLVGDKLREVLHTQDMGIVWYGTGVVHPLYVYEHGQRLQLPPHPLKPGGPGEQMLRTREPVVLNNAQDLLTVTGGVFPGT